MGNSKVVLAIGVSLIVGIYALGIKTAEKNTTQAMADRANVIVAEEMAKTGVNMALDDLASHPWIRWLDSDYTKAVGGDTIQYTIMPNAALDTANVVVVSRCNGYTSTVRALVYKTANPTWWLGVYRGRWAVIKMYAQPS